MFLQKNNVFAILSTQNMLHNIVLYKLLATFAKESNVCC